MATDPVNDPGYRLWLRYAPSSDPARLRALGAAVHSIKTAAESPVLRAAQRELQTGLRGLLDRDVPMVDRVSGGGTILFGTPGSCPAVKDVVAERELSEAGAEGFVIRSAAFAGQDLIVIASAGGSGPLRRTYSSKLSPSHSSIEK